MTYYVHEEMLGSEATHEEAKKMVELLNDLGYEVEYGQPIRQAGIDENGEQIIDQSDWDDCLSRLSQF